MSSPHALHYTPVRKPQRRMMLRRAYVAGARRASLAYLLAGIAIGALLRHSLGPLS